jgi:maltooligosyltrehalose synthase
VGLGIVLDIVPNHMAADEEQNPFWRDPLWRARFFDLDWRTGAHRGFFDIGELAGVRVEDPEVYEATHATVLRLAREGVMTTSASTIPTGSPSRRATSSGCASPASSASGWRRSSSRASACATGRSRGRRATSS